MLKKPHSQTKTGNIAKVKYFLPPSNQNACDRPQYEYNKLNQIKKSINSKYKASYSNSKSSSKRPSIQKIDYHGESLTSEINFNDASFEIIGIRDAHEVMSQITKTNVNRNYRYPLGEKKSLSNKANENIQPVTGLSVTFRNQKDKHNNLPESTLEKISKLSDFEKLTKNFPKLQEKQQFQKFLQNLKNDQNYQNTITMFTIMYFYEQKAKRK